MGNPYLTQPKQLLAADVFADDATQQMELGTLAHTADGRKFRYCLVGATALVPGKLQQSSAEVANHQNLTVTAAVAIGGTAVTVTLGGTAVTANQYAEGFLVIYDGTGNGDVYSISGHAAQATTTGNVAINLSDSIRVALDTTSKATLIKSPFSGLVVNPTTATSAPTGVAVKAVTAAQYGFVQTRGVCALLNDSATAVGLGLAPSAAVAGAAKTMGATLCQIGFALETQDNTKYAAAYLTID